MSRASANRAGPETQRHAGTIPRQTTGRATAATGRSSGRCACRCSQACARSRLAGTCSQRYAAIPPPTTAISVPMTNSPRPAYVVTLSNERQKT